MSDKKPWPRHFLRSFGIELIIYGLLLTAYFFLVLRLLGTPLTQLFDDNLVLYAFVALGLIVAQGAALDAITSLLVRLLGLDHFD